MLYNTVFACPTGRTFCPTGRIFCPAGRTLYKLSLRSYTEVGGAFSLPTVLVSMNEGFL